MVGISKALIRGSRGHVVAKGWHLESGRGEKRRLGSRVAAGREVGSISITTHYPTLLLPDEGGGLEVVFLQGSN